MAGAALTVARLLLFALIVVLWRWALRQSFSARVDLAVIVAPILLVFPTTWLGRKLLDARPTVGRIVIVTTGVHAVLMVFFGVAIVRALETAHHWRGFRLPAPADVALPLLILTAAAMALTVLNLALRGLGAPFAVALSRRLATDWMYAWTRNPMILATLSFLMAFGLWRRSALFLAWVLFLVAPAWLYFVKVYEERELELRFGEPYRAYRARTSFFWPRRPRPPEPDRAVPQHAPNPAARDG